MKIQHIIFDVGGVIILYGKHPTRASEIVSEIFSIPVSQAQTYWKEDKENLLRGSMEITEFLHKVAIKLGVEKNITNITKKWFYYYNNQEDALNTELLTLIDRLRKNYKIHILSNALGIRTDKKWMRKVHSKFDTIFRSCDIKLLKPEKQAYLHVLQSITAQPEECLFIDDQKENIRSAKNLHMKTVLFENVQLLEREFNKLGVVH